MSTAWSSPSAAATMQDNRPEAVQQRQLQEAANNSPQVQQLKAIQRNSKQGGPIQRKIKYGNQEFPTTWKGIKDSSLKKAAQPVWQQLLSQIGSGVNSAKLQLAWSKVAKGKTTYDVVNQADELVAAVLEKYNRSMAAKAQYGARNQETQDLANPLLAHDDQFKFVPSARNPMVQREDLAEIEYDSSEVSGANRFQTHVSTLMMYEHSLGQEAQAATRMDKKGMHLSTNVNSVNEELRGQYGFASDLKNLAAQLLDQKDIANISRQDAMNDRLIRHALKLFDRINNFLESDAPITVPQKVAGKLDGVHAEIRIEQDSGFSTATHNAPSGTKYPCMGCYLYFNGQKIDMGKWYGPMWVTNAALSQQLKTALQAGQTIGKLGAQTTATTGAALVEGYKSLPANSRMGHGRTKAGGHTFAHNADSDSEYEDDDFEDLRTRVTSHLNSKPAASHTKMDTDD